MYIETSQGTKAVATSSRYLDCNFKELDMCEYYHESVTTLCATHGHSLPLGKVVHAGVEREDDVKHLGIDGRDETV